MQARGPRSDSSLPSHPLRSLVTIWIEQIREKLRDISGRLRQPTTTVKQVISKAIGKELCLQDRLFHACIKIGYPNNHGRFIPRGDLLKLIDVKAVEKELAKCDGRPRRKINLLQKPGKEPSPTTSSPQDIKSKARRICGKIDELNVEEVPPEGKSYRLIFAILTLNDRPSEISSFLEAGICDADLPLTLVNSAADSPPWELRRKNNQEGPLHRFECWSKSDVIRFMEKQWIVLSPSFDRGCDKTVVHHYMSKEEILPFTSWATIPASGGCGQVYKVRIHSDHHAFNETTVSCFFVVYDPSRAPYFKYSFR